MWSNEWSSERSQDDEEEEEEIAECIGIPASGYRSGMERNARVADLYAEKFQLRDVQWAPDGKGLLLVDKDVFCCAFEVENDDEETD